LTASRLISDTTRWGPHCIHSRHDAVDLDFGHQVHHAVSSRAGYEGGIGCGLDVVAGERGKRYAVDHPPVGLVALFGQTTERKVPPHRVAADPDSSAA
jgi:hypothetical protein